MNSNAIILPPWGTAHWLTAMLVIMTVCLVGLFPPAASAAEYGESYDRSWPTPRSHPRTLKFDVAEIHQRFFFDEAPVDENGLPAAGNAFVTEGYIYPHGFLDDNDGVTEDGQPTAPDKVLGRWYCRGYFIGDGAATQTGAWVLTTQYYEFGDTPGRRSFASEGVEIADVGKVVKRGITGGTGPLRTTRGEVHQVLLGFQTSEAVKLRFTARFR